MYWNSLRRPSWLQIPSSFPFSDSLVFRVIAVKLSSEPSMAVYEGDFSLPHEVLTTQH